MNKRQTTDFRLQATGFCGRLPFAVVCILLMSMILSSLCLPAVSEQGKKKSEKKITTAVKVEKAKRKPEDVVPPDVKTQEDYLVERADRGRPVVPAYSIWRVIFSLLIVIGIILLLTYLLRFLWARGLRLEFKGRHIRVLDTLSLGLNRVLYLVQVGGKVVVLASTDKGINIVTEITDPDEIAALLEEYKPAPAPAAPFMRQLRQAFTRTQPPESTEQPASFMDKLKEKLSGLDEEK